MSRVAPAGVYACAGDARSVVDVGAGAGSYEARDRWVLAIEPSATMRGQRPVDAAPAIAARAESLPLDDDAVDAAMACVTIHHWEPPEAGLAEMRRIARSRVVVFTFELDRLPAWQQDYLAEALAIRRGAEACRRLATIGAAFPDRTRRRRSRARRLWPGSRAGSRVFSSGTRHVSRSMGSRRPVNRRSRERSPGRWATLAGR